MVSIKLGAHQPEPGQIKPVRTHTAKSPRKWVAVTGTAFAAGTLLGIGVGRYVTPIPDARASAPQAQDVAQDIRFCTREQFSDYAKKCLNTMTMFPKGTTDIYVSFSLISVAPGERFERQWFRNGEKFKSKHGFNDDAWKGYTYLINPNGHDPGYYAMRVIAKDQVSTGTFTVGQ